MKNILLVILILLAIFFISCQKELSCESCKDGNKPPIANAGADQTITLPKDSTLLDGSASTDPDGSLTSYKWIKIAGPISSNISKPDSSKTSVKTLMAGVYKFELIVTDNGGLSAKDTVQVMVDAPGNQPPIACAGSDQVINLLANTANLDGSCSADPDNNITAYNWTKISGPSSFNIVNANAAQTQLTGLVQGVYQFELKVTDAGGLFSKDTVQVIVNPEPIVSNCSDSNRTKINAQLIPVGKLSQPKLVLAVASAGNKILYAGGYTINPPTVLSRVDIYDINTNSWSIAELSTNRDLISAVAAGNKVFFAGGQEDNGSSLNVVDIYDVSTNTWTVSQLSRGADGLAAAAVGDKVFFAGGNWGIYAVNTVDIYNLTTNTWSTAGLSTPRNFITAVSSNNKVYFTGGDPWTGSCSNVIDIYDNATGTWSTSTLLVPRGYHAATAVNDILYFAGGRTSTSSQTICSVETLNTNTGVRSLMYLSGAASVYISGGQKALVKDNKIIFYDNTDTKKFDIYDIATNTWSIGVFPVSIKSASVIAVNNTIYVAGGIVNGVLSDKVYKLEF